MPDEQFNDSQDEYGNEDDLWPEVNSSEKSQANNVSTTKAPTTS